MLETKFICPQQQLTIILSSISGSLEDGLLDRPLDLVDPQVEQAADAALLLALDRAEHDQGPGQHGDGPLQGLELLLGRGELGAG